MQTQRTRRSAPTRPRAAGVDGRRRLLVGLLLALLLLAAAACDPEGDVTEEIAEPSPLPSPPSEQATGVVAETVVDVLTRSADFNELVRALEETDLLETLRGDGPFTVFAPTVTAFDRADPEAFDALFDDPEALSQLLLAHVVGERWTLQDLGGQVEAEELQSLAGTELRIRRDAGDVVTVNGLADITQPGLDAGNGVVHAIDQVIVPEDLGIELDLQPDQ
jgi:uncharacterized surface protein with fasciclin (FAS1) repeats